MAREADRLALLRDAYDVPEPPSYSTADVRALMDARGQPAPPRPSQYWPNQLSGATAYDEVMRQARGLQTGLTKADPVEMAMGLLGPRVKLPNPIKAYHGSPHDFDKFDLSKIGTGEGAQAYGHGLYFAEREAVAKDYRQALTKTDADIFQRSDGSWQATTYVPSPNGGKYAAHRFPTREEAEAFRAKHIADANPGKMYEVSLHATPEQFLDWDKPLKGQSEAITRALEPFRAAVERDWQVNPSLKGPTSVGQVVAGANNLRSGDALSGSLREAGIPGIKYLDQGSRGNPVVRQTPELDAIQGRMEKLWAPAERQGPDAIRRLQASSEWKAIEAEKAIATENARGTRNYVVWTPEIIEILRKYGIAAPVAGGILEQAYGDKPKP